MSGLIVAIDGPAGSGKSSVSRLVAQRLGLPHLDTGGHYRAATLLALRAGVDPGDEDGIVSVLARTSITSEGSRTFIDGADVEDAIRGEDVTAAVSEVSAHPEVRRRLVAMQRDWARLHDGGVVEGRDIGSVVFPTAPVKVFLTADESIRAERRARERGEDLAAHRAAIERRDRYDSARKVSPLTVPDGAVVIDTTDMLLEDVVDEVLALVPRD